MSETRARQKGKAKAPVPVPEKKPASRKWIYAVAALVALYLAFQVYAPALNGSFVFDDNSLPYHTTNFPGSLMAWVTGVRPLLMFSYWLNYQMSPEPEIFHLTNVLLHLLNSILIFLVVRRILQFTSSSQPAEQTNLLAGFAGAVFLLHPIQTESVAYIAGRSETLSVFFFLAAFAVFLYRRSVTVSWQVAIGVLALFGAAAASKEHTLVLPALLLLTDYYWNPGFSFSGIKRNWRLYLPVAAGGAIGLVFVARILARSGESAGFGLKDFTWYQYFFTQCRAFFVYLRLLIFPMGQDADWDFPISHSLMDHGAVFGLVAIVVLLGAAFYFRHRYPLASYGFFVYVLLLAPTSSFVPIKDPIAERRLYLPMIGALLILTAALRYVKLDRRKLAAAFGVVALVLAFATFQRNQVWASDTALWEDAAAKSPAKFRVHFQLAHAYFSHEHYSDALKEFAQAAAVQKPDYGLLVDWGLTYDRLNQPEQAIAKFQEAAALDPTAHVYSQMAMVYAERSRWPEALGALAQAEKADANYDMIYDTRGGIRAKTNDWAGAAADYQRALTLNPNNDHARQMLTIVQRRLAAPR